MQRIAALVKKEFKQIRRDRAMLAIIFIMPVVQLILLGYVISSEVRNIALAVVDQDRSAATRQVIARIDHSGYFNIHRVDRYLSLLQEIDQNRATVGLVLPHGLDKNSQQGRETMVQILLDGQDSNTGIIALGYLSAILQDYIRERFATAAGAAIQPPVLTAETQYWFNADLDYSDYMVPGIAALLLTIVTSLLSAMGLVREREIGTLEQLLVTPIKKHELLIGKIIPFAVLGLVELTIALIFAKLWYGIPIVGNLGLFTLFAVIYLFTTLGIGLLVSAHSQTQQQALFLTWFFMIFAILMSGFLFPVENMPRPAQWISLLNPLRYFMVVVRELFIKGAGAADLYEQGIALAVFGGVIFIFSAQSFQKRMK